jgi:hypothetical protein
LNETLAQNQNLTMLLNDTEGLLNQTRIELNQTQENLTITLQQIDDLNNQVQDLNELLLSGQLGFIIDALRDLHMSLTIQNVTVTTQYIDVIICNQNKFPLYDCTVNFVTNLGMLTTSFGLTIIEVNETRVAVFQLPIGNLTQYYPTAYGYLNPQ